MAIRSYRDRTPRVAEGAYVDQDAIIIGDVTLEDGVTVWPGSILRADDDSVLVSSGSAVMDMSFVEAPKGRPVTVGRECLISHGTCLHGCVVRDGAVIGVGAIVLDGAVIGQGAIIGAGSVVTPGTEIGPRALALGAPAKFVRQTTDEEEAWRAGELKAINGKSEEYRRGGSRVPR
jgi:carbonic anhydrase/acetyltransferase-like protein (isoleucine patch superfamily)